MRVGLLLPSIYTAKRYLEGRIFAPLSVATSLADGLVDKGHEVYLYGSRDIQTKAKIVAGDERLTNQDPFYYQFRYRDVDEQKYATLEIIKRDFEYNLTMKAYKDALLGKLDIIHSLHDFGAHYFNELTNFPTVYMLNDPLPKTQDTIEYLRLSKFTHHSYVSISDAQRQGSIKLNFIKTVYHGIPLADYEFNDVSQSHAIYFGRILEDKGLDLAIKVVKELKMSIKIASSKVRANVSETYYEDKIAPLVNRQDVILEGFLGEKEKSDFIRSGKVFILPLRWDEPFGLVMIEAMACGTPVVAFNRGSVPELIRDGLTGFIVDPDDEDRSGKGSWVIKKQGVEGLIEAVGRINSMPEEKSRQMRKNCRRHVEDNFTVEKMVDGYEKVYKEVSKTSS